MRSCDLHSVVHEQILGLRQATDLDLYVAQQHLQAAQAYVRAASRLEKDSEHAASAGGMGFGVSIEGSDDTLVLNPQRHMVLYDAKFASIAEVMRLKELRQGGVKDVLDLIYLEWALDPHTA